MTTEQRSRPLGLDQLPAIGPTILTMGVFDGVHRGHLRLIDATRGAADAIGVASAALVFDPPPIEVIRPGTTVPRLAPLEVNLRLLGEAGLDHVVPVRFDGPLRELPAAEFIQRLAPAIELRALVMTPDSAFGHGRDGTPDAMRQLGAKRGFELVLAEPLLAGGAPVSSSRIRDAVATGAIRPAAELLGHLPLLVGTVVVGDRRGRQLGFPTANLAFGYLPAMPPLGIYAGRVAVPSRDVGPGHPALISIGVRPTFHSEGEVLVEVHLLDFDGDLYGAELILGLEARLREERRFDGAEALVEQMRRDEAEARALLRIGR